jgi:hypothetical protein
MTFREFSIRAGPFWFGWYLHFMPCVYFRTPWRHFVVGRWEDRLFSERYGYVWCRKVFGLRFTIRKMKDTHG